MKLKEFLKWSGMIMIILGFWMVYVMFTGYPWWFTTLQKVNWMVGIAMLWGAGMWVLLVMRRMKNK